MNRQETGRKENRSWKSRLETYLPLQVSLELDFGSAIPRRIDLILRSILVDQPTSSARRLFVIFARIDYSTLAVGSNE